MGTSYKDRLFSHNPMLTYIEGAFRVGAAGAVVAQSVVGSGMAASSTLAVDAYGSGVYRIRLDDKFQRVVGFQAIGSAPNSSAQVLDGGGIVPGTLYQIITASSGTNWGTLGVPTGVTPSTGLCFVAASGASQMPASSAALVGNGLVARVGICNFDRVEMVAGYNLSLNPTTATVAGNTRIPNLTQAGSIVLFQTCTGTSGAPVAPTSGTVIRFNMMLRKSGLLGANETTSNY